MAAPQPEPAFESRAEPATRRGGAATPRTIIERQAIRRGTFTSVRDLTIKIRTFITGRNHRKHPFIWTKPADEILDKINRKRKHVSPTGH